MAILCEQCHKRVVSQHGVDTTNDVGERDLLSDLEQIDALMNQLRLRRADLKRNINHRCSPIIRQLPYDVLSVVFNFCLPDYTTFHTSLSKFDLSAPLILGAVCKDWRETAWSIPKLWSAMAINASSSDVVCKSQRSLAREWLDRSGLLPLSIRVVSKRDSVLKGPWNISHLTKLSLVLHPVSSRWHSFHLSAPPENYHAFCGADFSAPNLESLHFHCDQLKSFGIGTRSFRLDHCPRLQEIHITNVPFPLIRIPMANITRIYTDGLPIAECGRILHLNSVVHCELMNIGRSLDMASSPISSNLKHLTIQFGKAVRWTINRLLDHTTAPCLESLRVETIFSTTDSIDVDSLRSLLVCSAPMLHTLSLGNVLFNINNMVNVLGKIPKLKNLTVSISPYREGTNTRTEVILRFIARIIASQADPTRWPCFPCLETVTFTGHQIVRPSKVPHAISTSPSTPEHDPHRPLRSVTLKLYGPIECLPKAAIPFLLWLKDYGINLKVCDTSDPMEDLLQSSIDFYKSSSLGEVDDDDVDLDSSLELGSV